MLSRHVRRDELQDKNPCQGLPDFLLHCRIVLVVALSDPAKPGLLLLQILHLLKRAKDRDAVKLPPPLALLLLRVGDDGELPAVKTAGFGGFSTSFELPSTVSYTLMAVMRRKSEA